jgi:hypothetical protein
MFVKEADITSLIGSHSEGGILKEVVHRNLH